MNEHVALKVPDSGYDAEPLAVDAAGYDTDFAFWSATQAALLRKRRFEAIDLDNIIEEIESLGKEQAHAVGSHMTRLLEHLIKLGVSADVRPRRGWRESVAAQRTEIEARLDLNPSLRRRLPEFFKTAWPRAKRRATEGLRQAEQHLVPAEPPFTVEQALDPDFFLAA